MARAFGRFQFFNQIDDGGAFRQRTVRAGLIDFRQILHDDATRADVHVADFRIAHLTRGQTDVQPRRGNQSVRAGFDQFVPIRRIACFNGVVFFAVAVTPAVQNAQHDGTGTFDFFHGVLLRYKSLKLRLI